MTDQDNGYTAPKKIIEGPEGDQITLLVEKGRRPGHLRRRKPPRYPPPEVIQLIYDVRLQIKILWEAIKIGRNRFDFRAMDISRRGQPQGHNPEPDLASVDRRNK